jgi:hypothetical protein
MPVQRSRLAGPLRNRQRHPVRLRVIDRCLQRARIVRRTIAHRAKFLHAPLNLLRALRPQIRHINAVRIRKRICPRIRGGISTAPLVPAAFIAACKRRLRAGRHRRLHPFTEGAKAPSCSRPPIGTAIANRRPHSACPPPAAALRRVAIQIQRSAQRSARRRQQAPCQLRNRWSTYALLTACTACAAGITCACTCARLACAAAGTTQYCVLRRPVAHLVTLPCNKAPPALPPGSAPDSRSQIHPAQSSPSCYPPPPPAPFAVVNAGQLTTSVPDPACPFARYTVP